MDYIKRNKPWLDEVHRSQEKAVLRAPPKLVPLLPCF